MFAVLAVHDEDGTAPTRTAHADTAAARARLNKLSASAGVTVTDTPSPWVDTTGGDLLEGGVVTARWSIVDGYAGTVADGMHLLRQQALQGNAH